MINVTACDVYIFVIKFCITSFIRVLAYNYK
jgi:hypothetical protein